MMFTLWHCQGLWGKAAAFEAVHCMACVSSH